MEHFTIVTINYLTPAVSGIPTASERGAKSEVAHKWAKWLPHPCRIRDPHHCRPEGKIRSGPQVGKVSTSPLPSRGSPPLQSGGQSQKWCPKEGRNCCVTPAVSAIPKKGGVDMAHVRPGQKGLLGLSLKAVLRKKISCTSLFYKEKERNSLFYKKKKRNSLIYFIFFAVGRVSKKAQVAYFSFFGVGRVAKKA